MTSRDILRARLASAMENVAGVVGRRVRAGEPLRSLCIVVVDGDHPLATALEGQGRRSPTDGTSVGVLALHDARVLAAKLSPALADDLDGPVGETQCWCLAIGRTASLVVKASGYRMDAPTVQA